MTKIDGKERDDEYVDVSQDDKMNDNSDDEDVDNSKDNMVYI